MIYATSPATFIAWLCPPVSRIPSWIRSLGLALLGSALLTLSAKVHIPFWPVPMTMQTYAVAVLAMAYGMRLGVLTVALYIAEGAMGLPVFSGGGGLTYAMGTTGGFLMGFMIAAAVLGWLAERGWDRSFINSLTAMVIAEGIIFACGATWLAHVLGVAKGLAFTQAFKLALTLGVVPFVYGDVLKVLLGALTLPAVWYAVKHMKGQE